MSTLTYLWEKVNLDILFRIQNSGLKLIKYFTFRPNDLIGIGSYQEIDQLMKEQLKEEQKLIEEKWKNFNLFQRSSQ